MKWEIGLCLQIVSNPALFAVLVQRDVFSKKISTKLVKTFDRSCKIFEKLFASPKKDMVKVTFKLKVSDFIDPSMVQLYPIELAKQLVDYFCGR